MNALTRTLAALAVSTLLLVSGGPGASAISIDPFPGPGDLPILNIGTVDISVDAHLEYHCWGRSIIQVEIANNVSPIVDSDRWVAASFWDGTDGEWQPAAAPQSFEKLSSGESTTYWFVPPSGSFDGEIDVYVATSPGGFKVATVPVETHQVAWQCDPDGDDPDGDDPDSDDPVVPEGDDPDGDDPDGDDPVVPGGDDPDGDDPVVPDGDDPDGDDPVVPDGDDPEGDDPVVPEGDTPDDTPEEAEVDKPVENTPLFTG